MSGHKRNPLELPVEEAPAEIRRQRMDWDEGERVTMDDAIVVHESKVCRECGERLGHEHARSCPQREGR